ncbi:hypothetical protein F8388_026144 [Cannabis sativa]|uniref:Uncharacterized protein n=1 Tax=Cannabis sativa TaxID=3483 RepID=A0A7J6FUF5_CANSA|nr:hypothetical protein G4B88_028379 [Cannabis sativa]KAF4365886.1 hypothetical protein F8388_002756 [Cannabis sativa]KAF4373313.1 hypothetical protein F8388_026144 [Cannabis sativa]KAF4374383.1 hypothetical protein G4B88_026270 [Cannabis sativa]
MFSIGHFKSFGRASPLEGFVSEFERTTVSVSSSSKFIRVVVVVLRKLGDGLVLGGYNGQNVTSSVEIFDPRNGSWMMGDSMNDSRGYSAAAVIEDTIYAIGGIKGDNENLETVSLIFPFL